MTKELTTITWETIKVTPNHRDRTYTIRKGGIKYRTIKMDKDEFDSAYWWTGNDWKQFLKTDEYYKI